MERLRQRADFLAVANGGARVAAAAFVLQSRHRKDSGPIRIGFTVSKKVGNAPQRNRVKRRLRAAAGACAEYFLPQHDYVLVGRREALTASFGDLVADLEKLIARVGTTSSTRHPSSGRRKKGQ